MTSGRLLTDKPCFIFIFLAVSAMLCPGQTFRMTATPLRPGRPLLFLWNAPHEDCKEKHNRSLNLYHFDIVSSTLATAKNQSVSMFYSYRFGIFPHIDETTSERFHGGLPQLINFTAHIAKATYDIEKYIPLDQLGLAVLDFEEWRPQWSRNWKPKDVYRKASIDVIKKENSTLSDDEAKAWAEIVFERAAKRYFVESLRLGRRLKPLRKWGYYLYPECYNHQYTKNMLDYTGQCPDIEKQRNDELLWLWKECDAFFPSLYLKGVLKDSYQGRLFVRHRIQEFMRVSMLPNSSYAIPTYPYIRPVFTDREEDYMSIYDLVSTIGESAALGVAGIVSWGNMKVTENRESCSEAKNHLDNVMNPYMLNVSTAARLCSEALCQGRGRCLRKDWEDEVYLHLDARRYRIEQPQDGGQLVVQGGSLSQEDVYQFNQSFDCLCFSEQPCRFTRTFDVIPDLTTERPDDGTTTERPKAGGCSQSRPRPLLLWAALLALKYAVM